VAVHAAPPAHRASHTYREPAPEFIPSVDNPQEIPRPDIRMPGLGLMLPPWKTVGYRNEHRGLLMDSLGPTLRDVDGRAPVRRRTVP